MILEILEKPHSLVSNFDAIEGLLATYGPPWLHTKRKAALGKFVDTGIPTAKSEEFKYTPLRTLAESDYQPAYGATVSRADVRKSEVGKLNAITLAFINGEFAPELSELQRLPEGSFVVPLREALETEDETVLNHLGKIASLDGMLGTTNDERFVHLNTAYVSEGAFVFLPKNSLLEEPIHLLFASKADHGSFASHPRVLIVAEENAHAKIVESYIGIEGTYFTNSVTEIWLGENAKVEYVRVQEETETAIHISTVAVHQEANSTLTATSVAFGGQTSRSDLNVYLDGERTETWLNGAYIGDRDQVIDNHTRIDHAKANCNSFEVYKGILDGNAIGVFNGKIFVYEDAQKTDAKQTNKALLLSRTASINTKPQLEIFADDVKCTHGATVGQLSEEALFYLRSRGVPLEQARALLVYAFVAEVLEKISIEQLKNGLEKTLYQKLQKEA